MTTTRELCCTLSATLHLPSVGRWAEHLEARELLPGLNHDVCDFDAALLLASVAAAPNPADAPRVVTYAKEVMQDIEKQRREASQ